MKESIYLKIAVAIYSFVRETNKSGEFDAASIAGFSIAVLLMMNGLSIIVLILDFWGYERAFLQNLNIPLLIGAIAIIASQQIIVLFVLRKKIVNIHDNVSKVELASFRKILLYYLMISWFLTIFVAFFSPAKW